MCHVLIVGGTPADRTSRRPAPRSRHTHGSDTSTRERCRSCASTRSRCRRRRASLVIDEIERAFPDAQSGGTRLVLTQSTYLLQKWIDRLDDRRSDRRDRRSRGARTVRARGACRAWTWGAFEIIELEALRISQRTPRNEASLCVPRVLRVRSAPSRRCSREHFPSSDPAERLRLCREAVALDSGVRSRAARAGERLPREPRRRRRARRAGSRRRAGARLGSGRLRERQAVARLRRHGAGARRVSARGRSDADLLRRVQQSRRDARRARRTGGGARRRSARRSRTIRAASPFSTTSASSAASWDGSTSRRRRSAA